MKRLLSTNERVEMEIGDKKFWVLLSKIWKIKVIYKADKMGDNVDSWPISTSAVKEGEMKLFQTYWVFLLIKWLEKNKEIFLSNTTLLKITRRSWWLSKGKNWEILKARVLILRFLIYPAWIR